MAPGSVPIGDGNGNMIKTLRITSIAAAVLAVVFFAFPAVFGVRGDEQTERFLDSAGVIEKFNKLRRGKSAKGRSQESPLVKEANDFAAYLNPEKPKRERRTPTPRGKPIITPRPKEVSAKFTLIGTSYCASHPELSLALIDEVGKGLRWVRQSGKVGHLIIEQVKAGLVVVRDDQRTFELAPQRTEKRSLLKGAASSARTGPESTLPSSIGPKATSIRQVAGPAKAASSTISRRPPSSRPPRVSAEESAAMEKLMSKLKAMRESAQSDKAGSGRSEEDIAAMMGKLLYDYKSARISAEEAKRLDSLGEELKDVRQDPNRPRSQKIERPKRSREPNSPAKK